MNNVMLDLETMGVGPSAAIIAIGAVAFDLESGELGQTFLTSVNLESSVASGGVMDASTVQWWMGQSEEAKLVFQDAYQQSMADALRSFDDFLNSFTDGSDSVLLWGNGSDFDNAVLASAYQRALQAVPWRFYNNRCYRTVKNLAPHIKLVRTGTHHNALHDAISQAQHLVEIYKHLEVKHEA